MEIFKQESDIRLVLNNHSRCSVENELERTREEVERPIWETEREEERK